MEPQEVPGSEILIGTQLPPFRRVANFATWNRYAAVNYEFIDIHMDDAAGKGAGFDSAIGMGNLTLAYMHNAIADWLGDRGEITRFRARFKAPVLREREVVVQCEVVGIEDASEHTVVEFLIVAIDDVGVEIARGGARVLVDKAGQRSLEN